MKNKILLVSLVFILLLGIGLFLSLSSKPTPTIQEIQKTIPIPDIPQECESLPEGCKG